jgi:hypothetical protein
VAPNNVVPSINICVFTQLQISKPLMLTDTAAVGEYIARITGTAVRHDLMRNAETPTSNKTAAAVRRTIPPGPEACR